MKVALLSVSFAVLAGAVGALPSSRRLRRKESLIEIENAEDEIFRRTLEGRLSESSNMEEEQLADLLRVLQSSEYVASMSMMSMSMSMSMPPQTGTPATPAPVIPALTPAPTTAPVATMGPTTPAPVIPAVTPAPTTAPVVTMGPTTVAEPTGPTKTPTVAPTTPAPVIPAMTPAPTTAPVYTMGPTTVSEPTTNAPAVTSGPTTVSVPMPTSEVPTGSPVLYPTPPVVDHEEAVLVKCGVTSLERSRDILSILSLISDPVDLVSPSTPQFQARDWLDNADPAVVCADAAERIAQRYRVALLYFNLGGPTWFNCRALEDADENDMCMVEDVRNERRLKKILEDSNGDVQAILKYRPSTGSRSLEDTQETRETPAIRWLDGSNECDWYGLDCGDDFNQLGEDAEPDAYFPLITIDLGTNNLMGPLITELFGFPELNGFFMDGNLKITGTIPSAVSSLTKLEYFDIDDSELTGPLPDELYTLSNLIAIDLNANQLTGTLSGDVGSISGLQVLQLENNMMGGPLPTDSLLNLMKLGTYNIQ